MDSTGDEPTLWIDDEWLETVVVVGLTCFVLCLMKLSSVPTSKMGMVYGIIGMIVLIIGYWANETYSYGDGRWLIAASMGPGALFGFGSAFSVGLTSLPELVGAYNGLGGLAAALEGLGLYLDPNAKYVVRGGAVIAEKTAAMLWVQAVALLLSVVVGMATFTGSVVACLKLHGTISSKPRVIPFRVLVSLSLAVAMVIFGCFAFTGGQDWNDRGFGLVCIVVVGILASIYGVIGVMAIGGGDMPVSISFLNALSGCSTSMAGFMLSNKALVVSGAFISCSGVILTLIMCRNMNRSLWNVLVGGFGSDGTKSKTKGTTAGSVSVREASANDVIGLLLGAKKVIICPGYGMAKAKAQHAVAELAIKLRARGVNVLFAIHPVAGRLPGHMNVLLAEARVPYDITFSMDDINSDFPEADVALILGANDIVNPAAQTDPHSPIAGMPVLEVWRAKTTVVMKRSLNVGYAGVDNPLFVNDNNFMYLGDAKLSLTKLLDLLGTENVAPKGDTLVDIESQDQYANEVEDPFITQISDLQKQAFLKIGVCKEIADSREKRVAITPSAAKKLLVSGIQCVVERTAGLGGGFSDAEYAAMGCLIKTTAQEVCDSVNVIVKICEPTAHEIDMVAGKTMISPIYPATESGMALLHRAKEAGVNILAVDSIPRISRAQNVDTLSSQAKVAGYRAVIEAAYCYQRFFGGEVTAAGSFDACKVLVIGTGVAGLAAISTAKSLGAIVRAFDTRLDCRDQVESLGGEFLVLQFDGEGDGGEASGYAKVMSNKFYQKEMELFRDQARECQIIVTTAAIPGHKAPMLISKDAVDQLQAGSVVVDLAASTGGNCELTRAGETYVYDGRVTIIGSENLTSQMSWQASSFYANNMVNLLSLLRASPEKDTPRECGLWIDMNDPVIRGMTCVLDKDITWPPPTPPSFTQNSPTQASKDLVVTHTSKVPSAFSRRVFDLASSGELFALVIIGCLCVIIGCFAPITFVHQLLYFILASFLGYYLIWGVEPALFSPLMSTSNSLSGVVILGGILMASGERGTSTNVLACISIAVAATNVVGGFSVSCRMLLMFKKEK